MRKQVVIRQPFSGIILLTLVCSVFAVVGFLMWQSEDSDSFHRFIGVACIIFFGGGGLAVLIISAWKPIVIISSEGITVPYGRSKNFIPWGNVDRFKVVEQVVNTGVLGVIVRKKLIGIFVFDKKGIVGAGKVSQKIMQGITNWDEVPAVLINLSFSFIKLDEKVIRILQEFYDDYKNEGKTE